MENTGSNQPMMNDAQRAIYQQRMDNQYKIIQKNLQKRRLSYGMVTPTDLHPVTRSRPARSLPAKLPRTPEQLPGTPEQLPGTPEQLPGTPEPPPSPVASPTLPSKEYYLGDYKILRGLGQGQYGKVALAEHRVTGEQVAIKIIEIPEDTNELIYLYREFTIMNNLDHPNIVKLINVKVTDSHMFLVMEYCSGGNLASYIHSDRYRGEEDAKIFFRQIVSAVQYCHEKNVAHRDIKPENILLDGNNNIKITDFGVSNIFTPGETLSSFCGTPQFTAPEILAGGPYDGAQVDIWSLGVLLYNLVTNDYPFNGQSLVEIVEAVNEAVKGNKYKTPDASEQCRKLIEQMLTVDPRMRATMQEIIQSRWFREETSGSSDEESSSRSSASDSSAQKIIHVESIGKVSCPPPVSPVEEMSGELPAIVFPKIIEIPCVTMDTSVSSEEQTTSEEASSARVPWWKRVRNFFRQCCSCFKEPATSD